MLAALTASGCGSSGVPTVTAPPGTPKPTPERPSNAAPAPPAVRPAAPARPPARPAAPARATLTGGGCQPQVSVGDQLTLRLVYTPAAAHRYTLAWLDGLGPFVRNQVYDETLAAAEPGDIDGEYVFAGARPPAHKTIVAVLTAKDAGNADITATVWSSGDPHSAPPGDAPSLTCRVAISP